MREKIQILEYEPNAAAMHRNENAALNIDKSLVIQNDASSVWPHQSGDETERQRFA